MRWIALSVMVGVCNNAFAQSESWKLVVNAQGGWGQSFTLEVSASGDLVISGRRSTEMPGCAQVSDDDIAYVTQRIAELKVYVDNESSTLPVRKGWSRMILDGLEADLNVYLWPSSHVLTAHATLGPASLYELDGWRLYERGGWLPGGPPQFLADIFAKVWEWQRAGVAACMPVPDAP